MQKMSEVVSWPKLFEAERLRRQDGSPIAGNFEESAGSWSEEKSIDSARIEQPHFLIWTAEYVYFPEWNDCPDGIFPTVNSVPRHPTRHL